MDFQKQLKIKYQKILNDKGQVDEQKLLKLYGPNDRINNVKPCAYTVKVSYKDQIFKPK